MTPHFPLHRPGLFCCGPIPLNGFPSYRSPLFHGFYAVGSILPPIPVPDGPFFSASSRGTKGFPALVLRGWCCTSLTDTGMHDAAPHVFIFFVGRFYVAPPLLATEDLRIAAIRSRAAHLRLGLFPGEETPPRPVIRPWPPLFVDGDLSTDNRITDPLGMPVVIPF